MRVGYNAVALLTLGWIIAVLGLAWGTRRWGAPVWQWRLLIPAALLMLICSATRLRMHDRSV